MKKWIEIFNNPAKRAKAQKIWRMSTQTDTPPPALERGALVTRSTSGDGTPIYTVCLSGIPVFTTFSRLQAYTLANAIAVEMQKNDQPTTTL